MTAQIAKRYDLPVSTVRQATDRAMAATGCGEALMNLKNIMTEQTVKRAGMVYREIDGRR